MKICSICKDRIEQVNRFRLRQLRKEAMNFQGSEKEEMRRIQILVLKFANQKICEYCLLKELAYLTTIMRIKAMQRK